LVVTRNRPSELNAVTHQMARAFEAALARLRAKPDLKVTLIRSTGRCFCAGADLGSEGAADGPQSSGVPLHVMHRLYEDLEQIGKPVVAAHHAGCLGGGLEMSLSCDFRLAAQSAEFGLPESGLDASPAANGLSRLTRICGPHWARYMLMAQLRVTAAEALNMGLVHKVFTDDTFESDVMRFCRHLARQCGEQMGVVKLAIESSSEVSRDQGRHI
jgi:enoyl-CoA hydratase/carnithine racemase